jgi:hypothetical protein
MIKTMVYVVTNQNIVLVMCCGIFFHVINNFSLALLPSATVTDNKNIPQPFENIL